MNSFEVTVDSEVHTRWWRQELGGDIASNYLDDAFIDQVLVDIWDFSNRNLIKYKIILAGGHEWNQSFCDRSLILARMILMEYEWNRMFQNLSHRFSRLIIDDGRSVSIIEHGISRIDAMIEGARNVDVGYLFQCPSSASLCSPMSDHCKPWGVFMACSELTLFVRPL